MIAIELTIEEILNFQYILPVQGSLKTLELVEKILSKVAIKDNNEKIKTVNFEEHEIIFLKENIIFLDNQKKLGFQSLSLIKKILNTKGD